MKLDKNYYRKTLLQLIDNTQGKPIILSGKYKDSNNKKYITFSCIRPYIPGIRTYTICNHLNIRVDNLDFYKSEYGLLNNRKFYLIGYPSSYIYKGEVRGTIALEKNMNIPPIIFNADLELLTDEIINKCYKFNSNIYERKRMVEKI